MLFSELQMTTLSISFYSILRIEYSQQTIQFLVWCSKEPLCNSRSTTLYITFKGKTSLLMEKKDAIAFVQDARPATLPHTLLAVSML